MTAEAVIEALGDSSSSNEDCPSLGNGEGSPFEADVTDQPPPDSEDVDEEDPRGPSVENNYDEERAHKNDLEQAVATMSYQERPVKGRRNPTCGTNVSDVETRERSMCRHQKKW